MTMRDMTVAEVAAWDGLIEGKLERLADLLEFGEDRLHPILQRYLLKMIRGSSEQSDFRLFVDKHPDIKDFRKSRTSKLAAVQRAQEVARQMAQRAYLVDGEFDFRGGYDAAVSEVEKITKVKHATIAKNWTRHKDFIRLCIARGIIAHNGPTER